MRLVLANKFCAIRSSISSRHRPPINYITSQLTTRTVPYHFPTSSSSVPPPQWSFHGRSLPPNLLALSSISGKLLFAKTLSVGNLEAYFPLSEQFLTQSEPAFCGLTSLAMSLNALSVDPKVRWKGGWRWWNEELIGEVACLEMWEVKEKGITMEQFVVIANNNGAVVRVGRPTDEACCLPLTTPTATATQRKHSHSPLIEFRDIIKSAVRTTDEILVVSFSRSAMGQTGDGHFSPIAGYDDETDRVLVMDVARFKYAPYWAKVEELYEAMKPKDPDTGMCRGWLLVRAKNGNGENEKQKQRVGSSVMGLETMSREDCPVYPIQKTFARERLFNRKE